MLPDRQGKAAELMVANRSWTFNSPFKRTRAPAPAGNYIRSGYLPWVGTVLAGLMLASSTTVLSSRWNSGHAARARMLFLIPEEQSVPDELRTQQAARSGRRNVAAGQEDPASAPTSFEAPLIAGCQARRHNRVSLYRADSHSVVARYSSL